MEAIDLNNALYRSGTPADSPSAKPVETLHGLYNRAPSSLIFILLVFFVFINSTYAPFIANTPPPNLSGWTISIKLGGETSLAFTITSNIQMRHLPSNRPSKNLIELPAEFIAYAVRDSSTIGREPPAPWALVLLRITDTPSPNTILKPVRLPCE